MKIIKKDIEFSSLLFFTLLLFNLYILDYGYGIGDQNEQIPIIKRMMDSSYLENDWYVNQNDGFSVRYYFSLTMAYAYNLADLPIIYYSFYLISFVSILIGIYYITKFLFENNLTYFFTILLILLGPQTSLGSNWIVSPILNPSMIANAIALFAIYFFMKKQYYLSFILLGLATIFQLIIGILITIIFISYLFIILRNFKITLFSLILYLSIAAWNILPVILSTIHSNISSIEVMNIIGHVRAPWHYMPYEFSIKSYLKFIFVIILFAISSNYKQPEHEKHKMIMSFIYIMVFMSIIGTIFVEIIPIPTILKLQLFKVTPYLILFVYIYIVNFFRSFVLDRENNNNNNNIFNFLSYLHIYFKQYINDFVDKIGNKNKKYIVPLLLIISSIGLYFFISFALRRILGFGYNYEFLFIFSLLILLISQIKINKTVSRISLGLILILTAGIIYNIGETHLQPEYDFNKSEAYEWIKSNTLKEAIFIIPPYIEDFRLGADRAIVIDFKAFVFKDQSIIEWRNRIADLTNNAEFKFRGNRQYEIKNGFLSLNESDFIKISEKYNAQYIFVEKPKRLDFKELFENEEYIIYKVP